MKILFFIGGVLALTMLESCRGEEVWSDAVTGTYKAINVYTYYNRAVVKATGNKQLTINLQSDDSVYCTMAKVKQTAADKFEVNTETTLRNKPGATYVVRGSGTFLNSVITMNDLTAKNKADTTQTVPLTFIGKK